MIFSLHFVKEASKKVVSLLTILAFALMPVGYTAPAFVYADTTIFSDSFGSSPSGTVSGWDEDESSFDYAQVTTDDARGGSPTTGNAGLRMGASITQTIDTSGYENITLSFYWRGTEEAFEEGEDDTLDVLWRVGEDGDFTSLFSEDAGCGECGWDFFEIGLGEDASDTTVQIMFVGATTDDLEQIKIDDVLVTGTALPVLGSITVCKVIVDTDGEITDGSENPGSTFTVSWFNPDPETSQGPAVTVLDDAVFETPLSLNASLFDEGDDAECVTYEELELGGYYYSEESIDGDGWDEFENHDLFSEVVIDPEDAYPYDASLFDGDEGNDEGREKNADGHIVLTEGNPDRTLLVVNYLLPFPTLTVIKEVINDNDGEADVEDFDLFVGETEVESEETNEFEPGEYSITESGPEGYELSFVDGDCDGEGLITLAWGGEYVCYMVNDDIAQEEEEEEQQEEILGCTDSNASNFDSEATEDDGSCEFPEEEEEDNNDDNNGGGGGTGGGGTDNFQQGTSGGNLNPPPVPTGEVLGASTGPEGEVLGETCEALIRSYIKSGAANDADDVSKLQEFLNSHLGLNLPITGFYGALTLEAVNQFQLKYGDDVLAPWIPFGHPDTNTPTGYVYKTTKWKINNLVCPDSEPFPALP
ncbi:MAG: hypothetical protein COU47_04305 [Candidatus Niyogibacteria bacterium CG10_big_fil_rev_8_21_14_0_10_46_36]|uniref:Peptidoglycan binding-like domain-containing protein n=1 Tax=Candidatus Niyogibacteria bacterium CG10_big_fil_rev_8_21_14_0_10_46_36 TaxID=1974726 RepID=A0A2H0TEN5_9BACT|nr:MAG: hypothetical protein COU47_04305 [Candidatus Niyogibacteria bacterium CG10_big_fil_rev_8_21_14_0_10_46_36]